MTYLPACVYYIYVCNKAANRTAFSIVCKHVNNILPPQCSASSTAQYNTRRHIYIILAYLSTRLPYSHCSSRLRNAHVMSTRVRCTNHAAKIRYGEEERKEEKSKYYVALNIRGLWCANAIYVHTHSVYRYLKYTNVYIQSVRSLR